MTNRFLFVAVLASLPMFAVAQSNPGVTKKGMSSILIAGTIPGTDVQQVSFTKLSNNPDGEITAAVTAAALTPAFGGDGSSIGVVIGLYDPAFGTFLPTTQANALNSTADETFISLSPDGLHALVQRPTGTFLASRASVGTAFGAPTQVTGFGALTDAQASLGPVGGQMQVFYTDGAAVQMQAIDLNTATLTGSPTVVSTPLQGSGARPINPFPLVGADGDVEGLFMAEETVAKTGPYTGDADPVWAGDLDPVTPPVMMVQRPDYQCCGAVAGGHLSFSHQIASPGNHAMAFEIAWMLGDVESVGGVADVTAGAVNSNGAVPLMTSLFMSVGVTPKFTVAGLMGWVGLDPTLVIPAGNFANPGLDGVGSTSFPIPNVNILKGQKLAIQGVITDSSAGKSVLTSTSWLSFN